MARTEFCWKLPDGPTKTALIVLHDKKSVFVMAKHIPDAGVMDLYAKMPPEIAPADSSDAKAMENAVHNQQEQAAEQHDHQEQAAEQHCQQRSEVHLTVRPARDEKGKGIRLDSDSQHTDSEDSDFFCDSEADDSNSSADDEEAINYRQQAQELKKMVKKKMLGDEAVKVVNVPDEFVVPENCKLEDDGEDSPYFDTEDDISYSEGSDGEVQAVRTRKTKHRVYDEQAEVQEFELGQAFMDSR